MEEESEQEQDANALHQQLPSSLVCYKTNTLQMSLHNLLESILEGGGGLLGFCPLQLSLHNLLVQEVFWRGGVAFTCFSRENYKEGHVWL